MLSSSRISPSSVTVLRLQNLRQRSEIFHSFTVLSAEGRGGEGRGGEGRGGEGRGGEGRREGGREGGRRELYSLTSSHCYEMAVCSLPRVKYM